MSKIRLRDHSLGIEVERSINLSNLNWRGNDCLVVDNLQFRGKCLMGREHGQLLYQNITEKKWERDWAIGTIHFEEYVKAFFIICLNEWNLWMCSVLFLYINGIWECFLYWSFIWMGYVNVFFNVCWLNGIYECFLYRVLIWMESVNVSILFLDMNGFCKGVLYYVYMNGICESVLYCLLIWMESMNAFFTLSVFEWTFFLFVLIWIESMILFFIFC